MLRSDQILVYAEDTSPWMGCYGDAINSEATHISIRSRVQVFILHVLTSPAPVCSDTSALIVGQNAIRFGGHEHRSSRGGQNQLPNTYKLLPTLLQLKATTFNHGKTDYNFVWDSNAYNYNVKSKTDFADLVSRQPFFGQIQTKGGKNNTSQFPAERKVNPARVTVPADYPNNEIYWAWLRNITMRSVWMMI